MLVVEGDESHVCLSLFLLVRVEIMRSSWHSLWQIIFLLTVLETLSPRLANGVIMRCSAICQVDLGSFPFSSWLYSFIKLLSHIKYQSFELDFQYTSLGCGTNKRALACIYEVY